jgi:hypothetical protein
MPAGVVLAADGGEADSDDQREGDERRDLFRDVDAQGPCAAHEGGRDQRQRDRDGDHHERATREADRPAAAGVTSAGRRSPSLLIIPPLLSRARDGRPPQADESSDERDQEHLTGQHLEHGEDLADVGSRHQVAVAGWSTSCS